MTTRLRARLDGLALAKLVDDVDHGLWGKVLVVVIVDLDHRSVGTSTEAFDLDECELLVGSGLASLDSQLALERFENLCGTATAKHAWRGCAELKEVLSNRLTVEHGVEGSDLIDTHWWHLEQFGNIVHDRDRNPTGILALTKVEQWDDSRLLVLFGVMRDDLLCHLLVLLVELKGNVGIVVVGVAVNKERVGRASC